MASGLNIPKNNEFHLGRWVIIVSTISLLAASGWFAYRWYIFGDLPPLISLPPSMLADPGIEETELSAAAINNYSVEARYPKYISIPRLGIDRVRVKPVALTKLKTLELPKNISDVGWYKESALPGQGYSAVLLDGHGPGISRDGAFINLSKLRITDKITIERGDGKKISYQVVENRTESIQQANVSGMKRLLTPYDLNKEGLGIISLTGKWIPRDKIFDKRVLVRAVAQ